MFDHGLFNLLIALLILSSQGLAAKKRQQQPNNRGAIVGDMGEEPGDIDVFTSKGAQSLADLNDLLEVGAKQFEILRTRGPVEETLHSPYASEPKEEGEEYAETIESNSTRRMLNVFLPDTRIDVDNTVYPYRTVGLFGGCTGTLVYDKGIMVTNAHCLAFKPDGTFDPSNWDKTFYAGFKNGNYLASSKPKALWYNKVDDYAVIKLWSNLDQQLGRMGVHWRALSHFTTNRPLQMVSYSGDHCTSWNTCKSKLSGGSSRGLSGKNIKHDLDAKRGSSGSAMFWWYDGFPVMQALNFAENRNGGEASLVLSSYSSKNPNFAKPAGVWKYGYDKVKNF